MQHEIQNTIPTRSTGQWTVHTSTKARRTSVAIRIFPSSGSPPKFNHLFVGPLPTVPENFMQICLVVFAQLLTDKQTDKQTNNDDQKVKLISTIRLITKIFTFCVSVILTFVYTSLFSFARSRIMIHRTTTVFATVCRTVRPMLSDRCPVLSVCL